MLESRGVSGTMAVSFATGPGGAVMDAAAAAWVPPTWDEVVREHSTRVYRLAYRLSGNQQDAEDLTQETFVRVFRSLADYTPGTFEGWLHRITTNLFLDLVRRRQRIRLECRTAVDAHREAKALIGAAPDPGLPAGLLSRLLDVPMTADLG